MARSNFRQQPLFPEHDYASDHKLLEALKQFKTKRRLAMAVEKRPCGEIAAERIREFAWDLGAEKEWYRWIAYVSRVCGVPYSTFYEIATGRKTSIRSETVDKIASVTGIPIAYFYDEEM